MSALTEIMIETRRIINSHIEGRRMRSIQINEKKFNERNLYKTKDGYCLWLNPNNYLDQEIIRTGVWEPRSTEICKMLIKKGDVVLDIGANIGYYSILISSLVGHDGRIYAFEPTNHFGNVLKMNIDENNIHNCKVLEYGLSDQHMEHVIQIGIDSATMHWTADDKRLRGMETIRLERLDDVIESLDIERIDFIKIDVDGHEPGFLKGGMKSIEKYKPIILMEVAHLNYLDYGITAWDFYDFLKENGFYIYSEEDLSEIESRNDFLIKCGNFSYSANIVVSMNPLSSK